ncbi:MAG: putative toxin-antitoxin system toxin component, PIN family [Pyrinomonadaceae bacterium]|nr:putative toxin-antitoxin system toxin component, PIN family [Pyrinomonadaceae bacterium]
MIKAVFDCNVFWQIFFSVTGIGSRCWDLVTSEQVELIISYEVLDELRDVLTRPETQSRFTKATDENVDIFIEEIIENATFITSVEKKFEYSRDPKDEPYINLAVQTEAQYIVSRDKDLLDLMTGHDDESKAFRQRFRPLKVVDTLTFVQIVEGQQK